MHEPKLPAADVRALMNIADGLGVLSDAGMSHLVDLIWALVEQLRPIQPPEAMND